MNGRKPKPIDIAKLANPEHGEAHEMLKDLEGARKSKRSSKPRWPLRFTSVGPPKFRALRRND